MSNTENTTVPSHSFLGANITIVEEATDFTGKTLRIGDTVAVSTLADDGEPELVACTIIGLCHFATTDGRVDYTMADFAPVDAATAGFIPSGSRTYNVSLITSASANNAPADTQVPA